MNNILQNKRSLAFALSSFALGIWAFVKVNSVSGPAFEPILEVCGDSSIDPSDFPTKTKYHAYEPIVGLGIFKILVCLITQFLLELRETYPEGILTWGGVVVVSLPVGLLALSEAGRAGVKGPLKYPTFIGLLYQLFGISVMFPMVWVPSYILGHGKQSAPITLIRIYTALIVSLPALVLTTIVFSASTDSYLWTVSAGILGGPILALMGIVLWKDKSPEVLPTKENIANNIKAVKKTYSVIMTLSFILWCYLVNVVYQSYDFSLNILWKDVWVDANASVAFMTVDTIVLYLAIIIFVAYRSQGKALKMILITPIVGPGVAEGWAFCSLEVESLEKQLLAISSSDGDMKKKS